VLWSIQLRRWSCFAMLTLGFVQRVASVLLAAALAIAAGVAGAFFGLDKINICSPCTDVGPRRLLVARPGWPAALGDPLPPRNRALRPTSDPPDSMHLCIVYLFSGWENCRAVVVGRTPCGRPPELRDQSIRSPGWPMFVALCAAHHMTCSGSCYTVLVWHRAWRPFVLTARVRAWRHRPVHGMMTFGLVMLTPTWLLPPSSPRP